MKIRNIILIMMLLIISASFFSVVTCTGAYYKTGEFVPFEYTVPDGMITDPTEKEAMIQAKVKNLEETNEIFWGVLPADRDVILKLFSSIWSYIRTSFPGLSGLDLDWDKFGEEAYQQIEEIDNYGEFAYLMTRMALVLREGHSMVLPNRVITNRFRPNVPLFNTQIEPRIGACYTVTETEELIISEVVNKDKNPYNFKPGDEIVGFNGISWAEWYPRILEANIPTFGSPASSEGAIRYNLLRSGMTNANLFEKINIKRYGKEEIETLPIVHLNFDWSSCAEFIGNPQGVKPPKLSMYYTKEALFSGIVKDTNIGYVYITHFPSGYEEFDVPEKYTPYDTEFSREFNKIILGFMNTDGLIIDIRYHRGGWQQIAYKGLSHLIKGTEEKLIFKVVKRDNKNPAIDAFVPEDSYDYPLLPDDPDMFYTKPIIVITGPDCISGGDLITAFFDKFPEFTIIGNHNNGAFTAVGPQEYAVGRDTVFQYIPSIGLFYDDDENPNLIRRSDFIDIHVRHKKEDVAKGIDTVREYAFKLIKEGNKN